MSINWTDCARSAQNYDLPSQYLIGQKRYDAELPDNILLFTRKNQDGKVRPRPLAHHRYLLVFNFEGDGAVLVNNRRFPFPVHSMIFLTPHQLHLFFPPDNSFNWFYATFEMKSKQPWNAFADYPLRVPASVLPYLHGLAASNLEEFRADKFNAMCAALNIMQILNELLRETGLPESLAIVPPHRKNQVDAINEYLSLNFSRNVSIDEIAELQHLSASHLRRIYRAAMGITITDYLRSLRQFHARKLLVTTDMTLEKIARQCGYGSGFAFSLAFKHCYGIAPGLYRKRQRG